MSDGLDGVVVAETALSLADPAQGRLYVRGIELAALVADRGFEGTVALLWAPEADPASARAEMQRRLGAARPAAFAALPAPSLPIEAGIRRALAALPDDAAPETILATLAVAAPALIRAAAGQRPIPPDPTLSVAADLLRMVHGVPAAPEAVAALDTYMTVMAESGLSASSFAARVVASTRTNLLAAVLGAWCAFTGPLHGGAPGPTLDLLDALEAAPDKAAWIEAKLRAGARLMGFGHRLFRGNDPRAAAMRAALERMGPAAGRLALATEVEAAVAGAVARVKPGLRLPANVEIMAALLLEAVGLPRAGFTAVFAVSRAASWIAHAREQRERGRMFRPTSRYIGPPPVEPAT
ncbi:MAG TPA: citrate/2-methylcitrate synthase [Acetobacteraceae bacterium]|nr:citrate/2-methylcitrate synthase [Acetobacteraceae bacterium]